MAENEKQTNKERLKDITDSIERGIQDLFQSDKYAQYLRTMSRFHKYSVNNTMLIYMQKPDATLVAGFTIIAIIPLRTLSSPSLLFLSLAWQNLNPD